MFPQKAKTITEIDSETYPLGEKIARVGNGALSALVALSHTPVERRLYSAMLNAKSELSTFTVRTLMELTGILNLSTIRRGLEGLVSKFSVERDTASNGNGGREHATVYRVFTPEEIMARRRDSGMQSYATGFDNGGTRAFERVIQRVVANKNLSRREAQVALCCVEGLTNAEIGARLSVSEQTVKFHLRHIFIKFGVKRRAELISRLLL
jgi:DNA-binding CsgD family transcriptional regulator